MKKQSKEYKELRSIWVDMWRRCTDPRREDYARYGARGITVCEAWKDFRNFTADMGYRPSGLSLDRRDGALGYSKENCRWATKEQQDWNRKLYQTNTSGIKGVRFNTQTDSWQAYGMRRGIQYHLYLGPSKEQAIIARRLWEEAILTEIGEVP